MTSKVSPSHRQPPGQPRLTLLEALGQGETGGGGPGVSHSTETRRPVSRLELQRLLSQEHLLASYLRALTVIHEMGQQHRLVASWGHLVLGAQ